MGQGARAPLKAGEGKDADFTPHPGARPAGPALGLRPPQCKTVRRVAQSTELVAAGRSGPRALVLSPRLLAWWSPSSPPGGRRSRWPTATARSVPASCRGPAGFPGLLGKQPLFSSFHSEKPWMLSNLPEATHGARDPGLWCRGAGGLGGRGPGAGRPRSCSGTSLTLRAPTAGLGGPWLHPPCVDEESRGGTRGEHPSTAGERGAELGSRARPAGPTACARSRPRRHASGPGPAIFHLRQPCQTIAVRPLGTGIHVTFRVSHSRFAESDLCASPRVSAPVTQRQAQAGALPPPPAGAARAGADRALSSPVHEPRL